MHMTRTLTRISKACGSALAALLLIAAPAADASFSVDVRTSGTVPDLPDPAGRARHGCRNPSRKDDGSQSVIAAGGANFPQAAPGASTPEERGPKTYYQDIFKLRNGQWSKAGTLPVPLGYAAFASVGKGLAVAGGHNAQGILKDAC